MDQPGNNHPLLRANQAAHQGAAAGDRMRELLTRTAADHVADEWFAADVLEALHRRLEIIECQVRDLIAARESGSDGSQAQPGQTLAGIAATLDGLAATLGTFDGKMGGSEARISALDNRLERLDERLDDQYDRVTSLDGRLGAADAKLDALAGQFNETRTDISGRLASLEETLFTLAEVLLRPAVRTRHALENGSRS